VAETGSEQIEERPPAPRGRRGRGLRWVVAAVAATKLAAMGIAWIDGELPSPPPAQAADSPVEEEAPALAVKPPPAAEHGEEDKPERRERASAADVKAMLEELTRRQAEIEQREKAVAAREEKLALYEKDVTEKIAQLEQVGKSLKDELKRSNSASDEAAASLAKVYGAMKPSEAAPILDQLDEATALRILTRMKEKQVGEILPLMTRERAIVLTRSLAGRAMPVPTTPKG
jgi:flagellar motility protein MotE (MotC chaperone)